MHLLHKKKGLEDIMQRSTTYMQQSSDKNTRHTKLVINRYDVTNNRVA